MFEATFSRIIREVSQAIDNFANEQGHEPTKLKLTQKIYNSLKQFSGKRIPRWADSSKLRSEGIEGAFTKWPAIDTRHNRIGFYSIIAWDADHITVE